ncbi:MAG: undecaprenyl/decaprenyl-phosphate alpha-N-acetylglucosaminyl 1-phosphate transferase [Phycisphaerae bacterium]|nr:undecaprenyl/decaprenyl-phosphate alpha-N-acetylglucosaminyl 1-phosphate transferase [Phycisphaerae bacterium]
MPLADAIVPSRWPDWVLALSGFKSYLILFVAAALATTIATPAYILLAQRFGWVDQPWGRKRHERATATLGGVVIFAIVFVGAFVALRLDNRVGQMLREYEVQVYGLLICTLAMLLLGIVDDRHTVRPHIKLMVQSVVAIAAVSLGFRIEAVTMPFVDSVPLPVAVGYLLSLIWIVGVTNAVNLTDGLDGLAAGICFLASTVNAVVAIWLGNYYMSVMMLLLAGALLGFLRYNFHPARVFLGDTGSLALGMYLALASLQSAQKSHTAVLILVPLFALGYPIFDTLLTIARRLFRGQPLFAGDRDHIHHRLLDRSRSPSRAAIQIYAVSFLLSVACILAAAANHLVVGLAMAAVAILAIFGTRVLGYLEWGGWAARWSGREETRILHAAAALAKLKIRSAADQTQILHALSIALREMGCRRIELRRENGVVVWSEAARTDVASGFGDKKASETGPWAVDGVITPVGELGRVSEGLGPSVEGAVVELPVDDGAMLVMTFDPSTRLNEERSQLIEELAREIGERLQ